MQLAQTFLLFADTRYGRSSMAMFHCLSMTQTFKEDDKRPFSFVDKVSVIVMRAVVAYKATIYRGITVYGYSLGT